MIVHIQYMHTNADMFSCTHDMPRTHVSMLCEGQTNVFSSLSHTHTHTQTVIKERGVDASVRWMAITYIKNGVEKYWRPGAPK